MNRIIRMLLGALFTVGFVLGCQAPTSSDSPKVQNGLTINWGTTSSRSVFPSSYPVPTKYDLLLQSPGKTDVVVSGITTTSWSSSNLSRVVWTITVTGKDASNNVLVQGGSSVDLTTNPNKSANVTLQYIFSGAGYGKIHLTLDLSSAPSTVTGVTLTTVNPQGANVFQVVTLSGTTATFSLDSAILGAYYAFITVSTATQSASRMETIMVFLNTDTSATLKFLASDFSVPYHAVTGVSLSQTSLQLTVNGATGTLVPTILPSNATNTIVSWVSDTPSVATVSQNGVVTPVSAGTSVVKVTAVNGAFTASCTVTVSVTHVTSITLAPANLTLTQGGSTGTFTATVAPTNAWNKAVTWSSSNLSVATVNGSGVVTPLTEGSTTVTATSSDNGIIGMAPVTVQPNGQGTGTIITVTPARNTVTITGPYYLPASGSNPTYTASYDGTLSSGQWYVDGTAVSGATSTTFIPPIQGLGQHVLYCVVRDTSGLLYSGSLTVSVGPLSDIVSPTVGTLKPVLGGTFFNGTSNITLTGFHIAKYDVTRTQFLAVMGTDPSYLLFSSSTSDPVQSVNWYQAISFCNKLSLAEGLSPVYSVSGVNFSTLAFGSIPTTSDATWDAVTANWTTTGYRLPTEMQQMWSAMGGISDSKTGDVVGGINTGGVAKAFAGSNGSNSLDAYVFYTGNGYVTGTEPVGAKLPNELGIYDMSGNVSQWCWDWYGDFASGAQTNPAGAVSGSSRIQQGANWKSSSDYASLSARHYNGPASSYVGAGFRVVAP